MTTETWLPVADFPGYEISDLGRVKLKRGSVTTGWTTPKGYRRVQIGGKQFSVHSLVLGAFVGPRPVGIECRHLNGQPDDNRLENLRWGTPEENAADIKSHGRNHWVNKTHCPRGHELVEGNLVKYLATKRGWRTCLTCYRVKQSEHESTNRPGRGRCPVCQVRVRLRRDGTVGPHVKGGWRGDAQCIESVGLVPAGADQ